MENQRHPQDVRRSDCIGTDLSEDDLARVIEALTGERLPPGTSGRALDPDRTIN
jgi:hypothetical protein